MADKLSTPTYTLDLAALLRPLLDSSQVSGVLHLANRGACSWQEYAQWALDCCHKFGIPMRAKRVDGLSLGEMKNFVARRPVYTVLGSEKYERLTGVAPRDWHLAVSDFVSDHCRRDRRTIVVDGRLPPDPECSASGNRTTISILLAETSISASFSNSSL